MRPTQLSAVGLSAFVLSVLLLQWWLLPSYPLPLWLGISACGGIGLLLMYRPQVRHAGQCLIAIGIGMGLAVWSVGRTAHLPSRSTLDWHANGQYASIVGVIHEPPDTSGGRMRYTVDASHLLLSGALVPVTGRVLATHSDAWPRFAYGDKVLVRGKLERPGVIEDFHYDRYLALSGIRSVMFKATMERAGTGHRNPLLAFLFGLRLDLETRIAGLYRDPQSGLLAGLLVGSRQGIPKDVQENFRISGLTHLVAISGSNITLLLACLAPLLRPLSPRWRFLAAATGITAFTILVGASASVVRAALMGMLAVLAQTTGRKGTIRLTILWAAALMLLWKPQALWDDGGFQLSFLALLGLVEVAPALAPFVRWMPEKFGLREALQTTLAAQLLTAPWSMHLFGGVSMIAPLSNLLVPPAVPLAMAAGFISIIASLLWQPLALLLAAIASLPLGWIVLVADLSASVPGAAATGIALSGTEAVGIIVGLIVGANVIRSRYPFTTHTSASPSPPPPPLAPADAA